MAEVYVQLPSKVLIPRRAFGDISPRSDPLTEVVLQNEDLNDAITNNFPEGIRRDIFPNVPLENLVLADYGTTQRQLEKLKKIRQNTKHPQIHSLLGGLMTQMIHNREERLLILLNEVVYSPDEALIEREVAEPKEPQPDKGPAGFDTSKGQTPQPGEYVVVAKG